MQTIFGSSTASGVLMQFSHKHGRDYMMRSEKRSGYNSQSSPTVKPPRQKRKQAGIFYIFLSILLSVILWPVGMILLWRRKLRWRISTKFVASVLSLFVCVTLFGFGLTYDTGNPNITRVQDACNDFLDKAAEFISEGYTIICEKVVGSYYTAVDVGHGLAVYSLASLADGLEVATEYVNDTYDSLRRSIEDISHEDSQQSGEGITPPTSSPAPISSITPDTSDTPESTSTPNPEVTTSSAPGSIDIHAPSVTNEGNTLPIYVPEETPDLSTANAIGDGLLTRDREFSAEQPGEVPTEDPSVTSTNTPEASPTPTATPTPSPTPTPESTTTPSPVIDPDLLPKPAGEAVVYFYPSSVGYHMASSCVSMNNAPAKTLAEAVDAGKRGCQSCGAPNASILEEEYVIWIDDSDNYHLSNDCSEFSGMWHLMALEDALSSGLKPCTTCKAGLFTAACGMTVPAPSLAPTVVSPEMLLKAAGEAIVYHTSNGRFYHSGPVCNNMSGGSPYTLAECVNSYRCCTTCKAPASELVNENCLWQDENGRCHTTDECLNFEGAYTLIPRDEALANDLIGCLICGANEYLTPNTIILYE